MSYIYRGRQDQDYLTYFEGLLERNDFREYSYLENSPLVHPELIEPPILKIMFHSNEMEPVEEAYKRLSAVKDRTFTIGYSSPGTIDISPKSCGKRQAIEDLCARYEIQRSEVMALGDYETDLELIQWAGVGIVMGNAPATVKEQAPCIAPSNDHAGVATMLIRHVLKGDLHGC
jgi:hydroxymethylpyrimidine pyrophosphatase-like HAD family hydrolase